jgi:hypothetical protein
MAGRIASRFPRMTGSSYSCSCAVDGIRYVNGGVKTNHVAAQNPAIVWTASGPAAALSR